MSFSDSDWATCKTTRKSVSSGCHMISGSVIYSASRTQRSIALSSTEAEIYVAISCCCDALLLKAMLETMFQRNALIRLRIDNSAARQWLRRQGTDRIRHIAVRGLWLQLEVAKGNVKIDTVSTTDNVTDLGTKHLEHSCMI